MNNNPYLTFLSFMLSTRRVEIKPLQYFLNYFLIRSRLLCDMMGNKKYDNGMLVIMLLAYQHMSGRSCFIYSALLKPNHSPASTFRCAVNYFSIDIIEYVCKGSINMRKK